MKRILLVNEDAHVCVTASIAERTAEKMRGLIGRDLPGKGTGLLFRAKQIHTFGMGYPIDVVYLTKDLTVMRVRKMNPGRVGPLVLRARYVLEMGAGDAASCGLRRGMQLKVRHQ
ncbi:MAG TPA: DUF192 domain-containing protein [Actinomycetota bacterium]|nr:DUF192 domain-containing protein [Actinomycetota bacterium]